MTIFLFTLAPEGYKELDLPDGQSYADINCLRWNGEPKLTTWKTPDLVWFTNEFTQGDEQDGDFLKFRGGAPVVTERVKNLLTPLINSCVEFLPVNVEGETRYLINIVCVLDLMDKSKSTFKVYGDGTIGPCQQAYLKAPDETKPIFKVLGYLPRVFVTQSLQAFIEQNQLSGCTLREYKNP